MHVLSREIADRQKQEIKTAAWPNSILKYTKSYLNLLDFTTSLRACIFEVKNLFR